MRIWRRGWPLLFLAVAVGMAAALVLRWPGWPGRRPAEAGGTALDTAGPAVGTGTRIVYRTTYLPCGTTEERTGAPPPALIGMRAEDIARVYPQWTVSAFSAAQVVLSRETEELCPEYREWRHVRLVDGEVVVYYGKKGSTLVKERTGIRGEALPAADRELLAAGVDLPGDEAVRAFLEQGP